jgi:hypothetical protein
MQWALAWFPLTERHPRLPAPLMRNGTIQNSSTDFGPGLGAGSGQDYELGRSQQGGLLPDDIGVAFAAVYGDLHHRMSVTFEVHLYPQPVSRGMVDAPPGQRLPFMFNLTGEQGSPAEGTALSLWGTIVTSSFLGTALADVSRLGGGP